MTESNPIKMSYQGTTIFTGLDIHKKSWAVHPFLPHISGKPINMSEPSTEKLIAFMERNYPGGNYVFAYEAGFSGFWLSRQINEAGYQCYVINASDVPTSGKEKVNKTDRIDARKIGSCLRAGQLTGIHIPDEQLEDDRTILANRNSIAKKRRRVMSQIRSRLAFKGYLTQHNHWSKAFLSELEMHAKSDILLAGYLE